MASSYSDKRSKPIGVGRHGLGGAGLNLDLSAISGETEMVTVFDDFNHIMEGMAFGEADGFEECGWVLTDVGAPASDAISMNDPQIVANGFDSCLRINCGTDNDTGGNFQLNMINADMLSTADQLTTLSGRYNFPHIWIPENTTATILDNTILVFACRVGFVTSAADGIWTTGNLGGKLFIGYSVAGETAIMTAATGVISVAGADDILVGFHVGEDGSIDGISQRTGTTAYVEGTNFTELQAAGAVSSILANGVGTIGDVVWYDLAFRMQVDDMSETANGTTTFYYRRVLPEIAGAPVGGRDNQPSGSGLTAWREHPTVLENQTPNHTVALVPTIEAINGPNDDTDFLIDWWVMGTSRYSRQRR